MINQLHSFKNYTNVSLKHLDASEFSNTKIKNTCFYQELKEGETDLKDIFPDGVTGLSFMCCNLDNVLIPKDTILEASQNRLIVKQLDEDDWVLDKTTKAVIEPANRKLFELQAKNIDPTKIVAVKLEVRDIL